MNTELENEIKAPMLAPNTNIIKQPGNIEGLPIIGESVVRDSYRRKSQVLNPDLADTRTHFAVKEQADQIEKDQLRYQQYVREFVANAEHLSLRFIWDFSCGSGLRPGISAHP